MALGDWNEVEQVLRDTFIGTQYSNHASEMLALIPTIRSLQNADILIPGTSLATLFLRTSNPSTTLYIFYEGEGRYVTELQKGRETETEISTVDKLGLLDQVRKLINDTL